MPHQALKEYLLQGVHTPFEGWDFSYLNGTSFFSDFLIFFKIRKHFRYQKSTLLGAFCD